MPGESNLDSGGHVFMYAALIYYSVVTFAVIIGYLCGDVPGVEPNSIAFTAGMILIPGGSIILAGFLLTRNHFLGNFLSLAVILQSIGYVVIEYAKVYLFHGVSNSSYWGITNHLKLDRFDSLYFSITTFTTLGYGDFSPLPENRLMAGGEALLGYIMLGVFVSILFSLITWRR